MNVKNTLFIGCLTLLICSCTVLRQKQSKLLERDEVELLSHEIITEDDLFYAGYLNVGLNINSFNRSSIDASSTDFGIGAGGQFNVMKYGQIDFDFYYPLKYNYNVIDNKILFPDNLILQHDLSVVLTIPLYSFMKERKRVVFATNEEEEKYFLIGRTTGYEKFNGRLGFNSDYKRVTSNYYSNVLESKPEFNFFSNSQSSPFAAFDQRNNILKIGGSYQICLNTKMTAVNKDEMRFNGRLSQIIDFYFDVNILLTHKSEGVNYTYNQEVNFGVDEVITEYVKASDFMDKKNLGFTLGVDVVRNEIRRKIISGYCIELDVFPGYYRNAAMAANFKLIMKFGYGFWK